MTDTVSALRQEIQRLDARLKSGNIDAQAHAAAKQALERRLVDAVLAQPPAAANAAAAAAGQATVQAAPRPSTALVALLSAGVLVLAGAGYAYKGSPRMPSAGPPGQVAAAAAGAEASPDSAENAARFEAMVEQLAQKLKEKPDNAEGWAMLARSYGRLGKTELALPAFAKAVALKGDDAALLADYADLMAVQNNRTLAGEPTKLIERALKVDANHPKALALAGSAAFDRKDFAAAVKYWEQLGRISPPGSEFLAQLQSGIDEARKLGGLPAGAPIVGMAAAAPMAAAAASAPAAPVAGNRITGTVRLAPALAAQAAPEDTVFVLARPADGSRMPLAVQRYKVKDLPVQFSLDDSMAMAPQARLSLHEKVVVAARISKSGQAIPAPGDISGQSQAVSNNARDLVIELSEVVKP